MKDSEARLIDLLTQGPPEEDSYLPPPLPTAVRVVHVSGRTRSVPHALAHDRASLFYAAAVAVFITVVGVVLVGGRDILRSAADIAGISPHASMGPVQSAAQADTAGWSVMLPTAFGGVTGITAADGSLFIAGTSSIEALDPSGRERAGWPIALPVPAPVVSLAVAQDGSLLVASASELAAVEPSGRIRAGWPVVIGHPDFDGPFVMPSGMVLVADREGGVNTSLIVLTSSGAVAAGWPQTLMGQLVGQPAFGPDGTIAVRLAPAGGSEIGHISLTILSPHGAEEYGSPITSWDHVAISPANDVVVWSYVTAPSGGGGPLVQQTRVAILATDGQPSSGWPRVITGPASAPAFGADGTLYLVQGRGEPGTGGSVLALDRGNKVATGWPVSLPASAAGIPATTQPQEPHVAQPPVVGPDGTVFVAASSQNQALVAAFDRSGAVLPGWPFVLPGGQDFAVFSSVVPNRPPPTPLLGKTGLTFLVGRRAGIDNLFAVERGGQLASGWPVPIPQGSLVSAWAAVEDGGVEVQYVSNVPTTGAARYGPEGGG